MLRRKLATVTLIVIAAAVGVGVWLSPPKVAERDTEVEMPAAPTTPANWVQGIGSNGSAGEEAARPQEFACYFRVSGS